MRRAAAGLLVALAGCAAVPARAQIVAAELVAPTARYDHAVLGDALEWGGLRITLRDGAGTRAVALTLPETRVFEDVDARLWDVGPDPGPEVVVVETDLARGAALAVYGAGGLIARTAFLGQPHRWLAPAGAADFDGDGRTEIAYVDRPHLARELVFVRLEGGRLVELARQAGLTNHRIGDDHISGGVRDCGAGAELVLVSADWARVMLARLEGGRIVARDAGPYRGAADLRRVQTCMG